MLLTVTSHIDDATLCYYEQHSCCVKVTPAETGGEGRGSENDQCEGTHIEARIQARI